jgi:hypothetical protein
MACAEDRGVTDVAVDHHAPHLVGLDRGQLAPGLGQEGIGVVGAQRQQARREHAQPLPLAQRQ